jgi:hypothetical protein
LYASSSSASPPLRAQMHARICAGNTRVSVGRERGCTRRGAAREGEAHSNIMAAAALRAALLATALCLAAAGASEPSVSREVGRRG